MASGINKEYLKSLNNQLVNNTTNSVIAGTINFAQKSTSGFYKSDLFNLVDSSGNTGVTDKTIKDCLDSINIIFYDSIVTVDISGVSFNEVTTYPSPTTFKDINDNIYTETGGYIYDSQGNFYTTYNTPDPSGNITFSVNFSN